MPKGGDGDCTEYTVAKRRVFEEAAPKKIRQDDLEKVLREGNVLFYTGAGISKASNVPYMDELISLLGIEEDSVEEAIQNPEEFVKRISQFHLAALYCPPTKAHLALKELARLKNVAILTENLDGLHEASGVFPYRIDPMDLKKEGSSLGSFEYVICLGLSHDDRGFLGYFKELNPEGKIIAIDLHKPSYLGYEDYLLVGDVQVVIPALRVDDKGSTQKP